jgi:hypothetical protein
VQKRCEALGFALTADELSAVYHGVVTMGEHRKSIGDNDLKRIVERVRTTGGAAAPDTPHPEAVGYGHGV